MDLRKVFLDITYLRNEFQEDTKYAPPTSKSIGGLVSLMKQGLHEENRISALKLITGIGAIESSKLLTQHVISTLIDFLKEAGDDWEVSERGRSFLHDVEEIVEARSFQQGEKLYAFWLDSQVSDMQDTAR
jgi:hypothetical protein